MQFDYEKISLTAQLAAYMRQFSDIPFASDVAELMHSRQVLELASGLSLRGLVFAQDVHCTYIESDLTGISAEKKAIIDSLRQKYGLADHANLHFPAVNVLDRSQLQAAVKYLDRDQPLVIVNEGLLLYLSPDEMRTVVGNLRELLAEFKGCWITPDFSIKDEVNQVTDQQRNFRRIVAAATEHKLYNNAFDSLEQLMAFLHEMGLSAALHNPLDEIGEMVSLRRLHLPAALLDPIKASLRLWELSLPDPR